METPVSYNVDEISDPFSSSLGADSDRDSKVSWNSSDSPFPWEDSRNKYEFSVVHSSFLYDPLDIETLGLGFDRLLGDEALLQSSGCTAGSPSPESLGYCGPNPPSLSSRVSCDVCGRPFENANSLERHAKSSGHRAFSCRVPGCDKSYCRRDLWTRHRRTHTLKPVLHICELCRQQNRPKEFSRRDHLRQHVRNCHPQSSLEEAMSAPMQSGDSQSSKCSCKYRKSSAGDESSSDTARYSVISVEKSSTYESRAIQEIVAVAEATGMEGHETDGLKWLENSLNLKQNSTTAQLVQKIGHLAAREGSITAPCSEA